MQAIIGLTSWLFPYHSLPRQKEPLNFNEVYFESPDEGSLNLRKATLRKNQNIGAKPYFRKYLEFTIGEDQIPDVDFKNILMNFSEKEYNNLDKERKYLESYSSDIVYEKFSLFEEDLNEVGTCNFIKYLFTDTHFSDSFNFGRQFTSLSRNSSSLNRKAVRLLSEVSSEKVLDVLTYITDNNTDLHSVGELLLYSKHGYEESGEVISIKAQEEVSQAVNKFIERLFKSSIEVLFRNPATHKNWRLFNLLESFENVGKLKEKIETYIYKDCNVLNYIKSLSSMASPNSWENLYYNSNMSLKDIAVFEKYASRIVLINSLKSCLPDIQENYEQYLGDAFENINENYNLATQYLNFVDKDERKLKEETSL